MSCNSCNDNCQDTNPCYEDCGCLNPTTFKCTSYTGADLPNLEVTDTTDGEALLGLIDTKIGDIGKVLVDGSDDCPALLEDKLEAGLNISIQAVGEGCNRKLQINASSGGVAVDVKTKVSANDTTSDHLYSKTTNGVYISRTIENAGGNEKLKFDLNISSLVSADSGNQLSFGSDGKLKTLYTVPDGSETKIVQGNGVIVTGIGTMDDPYVVATNDAIQIKQPCFDGVWRNLSLLATGNAAVAYISGTPQYRFRYDGSVEFRGQAVYTVAFAGTPSSRRFTVTIANLPTSCLTLGEQAGTSDLKGINYVDTSLLSVYGYIIRKATEKIILEFQTTYENAASKTIVVSFDGCVSHPIL